MIVAFSTSSAFTSVAVFESGELLWDGQEPSNQRSTGACLSLLEKAETALGRSLKSAQGYLADLGPGSFTGVRVGVSLAKALSFGTGVRVAGATAFDLIWPDGEVAILARKGHYYLRVPGLPSHITDQLSPDLCGIGPDLAVQSYPHAKNFGPLLVNLSWVSPAELMPEYIMSPSISTPNKPFSPFTNHS